MVDPMTRRRYEEAIGQQYFGLMVDKGLAVASPHDPEAVALTDDGWNVVIPLLSMAVATIDSFLAGDDVKGEFEHREQFRQCASEFMQTMTTCWAARRDAGVLFPSADG